MKNTVEKGKMTYRLPWMRMAIAGSIIGTGIAVLVCAMDANRSAICPAEYYHWVQAGRDFGDRCLWDRKPWRFWCSDENYQQSCHDDFIRHHI